MPAMNTSEGPWGLISNACHGHRVGSESQCAVYQTLVIQAAFMESISTWGDKEL